MAVNHPTSTGRAVVARFTPARRTLPNVGTAGHPLGAAPKTLVSSTGFGAPAAPGSHAPGGAGAAGPRQGAPLPVDPQYDAAVAIAARQRDARLAALSGQRAQTLGEIGYNPQTDAAGNITGLVFDSTNPFSQAALAKKAWDNKRKGNTTSYAARGQLYAGSLQNAQNDATTGELQGRDALQKALIDFLSRNTAETTATRTGFEDAVTQADADRITRAPTSPLYQPIPDTALPSTAALEAAAASSKAGAEIRPAPGGHPNAATTRRVLAERRQPAKANVRPPSATAKFKARPTPLRYRRP